MADVDPVELRRLTDGLEWCRKCRDELPYGAPAVRAAFIPWGRLFGRDELVGPCCEKHLPKSVDLGRIDQYAVFDLRPVLDERQALLDRINALEARQPGQNAGAQICSTFTDGLGPYCSCCGMHRRLHYLPGAVAGEPGEKPPRRRCGTCLDTGLVPATGRGSDGYEPCPACVTNQPGEPESEGTTRG